MKSLKDEIIKSEDADPLKPFRHGARSEAMQGKYTMANSRG